VSYLSGMVYYSASTVVIHDEEALYQVYAPLPYLHAPAVSVPVRLVLRSVRQVSQQRSAVTRS